MRNILRSNASFLVVISDSYVDNLTKEIKSVEEEKTKIELEMDHIMDTFATGKFKLP
jgi:hypothetical protein